MREHHAELVPIFAAQQPPWREIAAELTAGGVRGGKGKALTGRALAGIWGRVCVDLAAAEAKRQAAQQKARMQPSRLPADWRPTPTQPVAPKLALPSPAHIQEQAGKDRYAGMSQQARETMEDLDRQLREYDNRQRGWNWDRREG